MNKIIKLFKSGNLFKEIYGYLIGVIFLFSPVKASQTMYRVSMGKKLNLKNPKGFNEKLMWLKHYWNEPLKGKCSDKLLVRNYVIQKECKEILNGIYSVFESVEEIQWDDLPEKFVLKCTYGAGANVICKDKNSLDILSSKSLLKKGLKPSFLHKTAEFHGIKTSNKIICEKYIETKQGEVPIDYKVYCFNGEPKVILAMKDRNKNMKRMFYDINWIPLYEYANREVCNGVIEKPENLEKLIYYSRKLSEGFPFVRVDLFSNDKDVIFGELTFTPAACLSKSHNSKGDLYFGELLKLPTKSV